MILSILLQKTNQEIRNFIQEKKNTINQGTPSREEGTSSDGVKTFNESFDIIIPNQIENSNPVAVSATQLIPLTSSIQAGVEQPLKINIEENVDASGHHIFTPTEIGEMTPEEFEKNLPVIEQQLRDGLIKQSAPKIDYTGYVNPVSGDGKIYSRDEIAKLTTDEYIKLEPEIISQLNTIGIPTEKELEKYTAAGDLIYVHPYTRSDGTKVRGYYRAAR